MHNIVLRLSAIRRVTFARLEVSPDLIIAGLYSVKLATGAGRVHMLDYAEMGTSARKFAAVQLKRAVQRSWCGTTPAYSQEGQN